MPKSADAFRTISEVADWLGIQAHVLRFWESKFTQVRPVKRAGGRRYYRPNDMLLLGGIKQLLHEDGLTIKGVQKILREEGISHVVRLSQPLDELTQSLLEETPPTPFIDAPEEPQEETGVVLSFDKKPTPPEEPEETETAVVAPPAVTPAQKDTAQADAEPVIEDIPLEPVVETAAQVEPEPPLAPTVKDKPTPVVETAQDAAETPVIADQPTKADALPVASSQKSAESDAEPEAKQGVATEPESEPVAEPFEVNPQITIVEPAPRPRPEPTFDDVPLVADEIADKPEAAEAAETEATPVTADSAEPAQQQPDTTPAVDAPSSAPAEQRTDDTSQAASLPAFLRRPMADQPAPLDNLPADSEETPEEISGAPVVPEPTEPSAPPAPKPRIIDVPVLTPEHEIAASPAVLTAAYRSRQLSTAQARQIAPLLQKLTILRDSMASSRTRAIQTGAPTPSND